MSDNKTDFLSIEDLTVEYTTGKRVVHAVNHVSLTLEKGNTLGLVGETGAGKTTIARTILRILPDPPARIKGGRVLLEGQDVLALPESEMLSLRGSKIAMIFQDPMTALNPVMTVGEQIYEGLAIHNKNAKKEDLLKRTTEMLEMVGIPGERASEYPHQFSGGMKQRVVIAMALACEPELLLADEPTTALDVTIQAQVLELINNLKYRFGTSMILITHDLGVVANTCDYVAVIYAGQIVEYGTKRDIFKNARHPYTVGLFNALPKLDVEEKRLRSIPGRPPDPSNLPQGCVFHPRCAFAQECCSSVEPETVSLSDTHICKCHLAGKEVHNGASH